LSPLPIADDNLVLGEIQVLNPRPQAFHQSQATALQQLGHQLVCARQKANGFVVFFFGQDGGQP